MITSNISSAPFSLFSFYWQSYQMHVIPSVIVPQLLNILFHFFILLFFTLQFGNFLLTYLQDDSSLGGVLVTSLPVSRSKLFFVLSQLFYFQHFLLVLRALTSVLMLSGSRVLCTFLISALSIINHGYFNSQSDNSKISATPESVLLLGLAPQTMFFPPLSRSCLLTADMVYRVMGRGQQANSVTEGSAFTQVGITVHCSLLLRLLLLCASLHFPLLSLFLSLVIPGTETVCALHSFSCNLSPDDVAKAWREEKHSTALQPGWLVQLVPLGCDRLKGTPTHSLRK